MIGKIILSWMVLTACNAGSNGGSETEGQDPAATASASPGATPEAAVSPTATPTASGTATGGTTSTATTAVLASTLAISNGTTGVVITPAETNKVSAGIATNSFYTVNDAGNLGALTIFQAGTGLTAPSYEAQDFVQTDTFMIFVFAFNAGAPCDVVIRRKADDKLFCALKGEPAAKATFTGGAGGYQVDSSGNLYLMKGDPKNGLGGYLLKVDLSNPDNPTSVEMHQFAATPNFLIHPQGDAFVVDGSGSASASIKKKNGGIQNIGAAGQFRMFLGRDDAFYWIKYGSQDITKLTRASDGSYTSSVHAAGVLSTQVANLEDSSVCRTSTDIYGGDTGAIPSANAYNFIQSPASLNLAGQGYASWSGIRCGAGIVYILGTNGSGDSLIKSYVPQTTTWATVLPAADYTVSSFEVGSGGAVFFTGLRNSDGAKVLARIASPGAAVEILNAAFFAPKKLVAL